MDIQTKQNGLINRDLAGGFGSRSIMGDSILAKAITLAKRRGIRLPVMSLGYLASIFYSSGWEVEVCKNGDNIQSDLVIIASSIVGYKDELEAAKRVKRNSKAIVGFIGPFSAVKREIFFDTCDFIIDGEPEEIAMKMAKGYVPKGLEKSNAIEDLDILPFPKWDLFPVNEYSYFPTLTKLPFMTIQSSRGCPFSCYYYCPYIVQQGRRYRYRSVDSVVREIEDLQKRFLIRGLLFRDPIFTFNKERAINIAEEMIRRKSSVYWACETHLSTLSKELIDILYRAGLRAINVGIEGINKDVLERMHRVVIDQEHRENIIVYCEKKGIKISAFYILGSPSDNKENIGSLIKYAKKLNTSAAQFTISTPYPGTLYHEDMKDKIDVEDWEKFNGFTPVFKHPTISKRDLLKLKEHAFTSFYFQPRWLLKFIVNNLLKK